jgi:hypothetical protein
MEENPYESPRAEGIPPAKQPSNRIALGIILALVAAYLAFVGLYVISELRYKAERQEERQKSSVPSQRTSE